MQNVAKYLLLVVVLFWTGGAWAENTVVIVHKDSALDTISQRDLSAVYLYRKKTVNNVRLKAVELYHDTETKTDFHRRITGKNLQQLKAYWSRLVFTGKGIPPYSLDSETRVVDYVSVTPNAIGYVRQSKVNDSVKVINVLGRDDQ